MRGTRIAGYEQFSFAMREVPVHILKQLEDHDMVREFADRGGLELFMPYPDSMIDFRFENTGRAIMRGGPMQKAKYNDSQSEDEEATYRRDAAWLFRVGVRRVVHIGHNSPEHKDRARDAQASGMTYTVICATTFGKSVQQTDTLVDRFKAELLMIDEERVYVSSSDDPAVAGMLFAAEKIQRGIPVGEAVALERLSPAVVQHLRLYAQAVQNADGSP